MRTVKPGRAGGGHRQVEGGAGRGGEGQKSALGPLILGKWLLGLVKGILARARGRWCDRWIGASSQKVNLLFIVYFVLARARGRCCDRWIGASSQKVNLSIYSFCIGIYVVMLPSKVDRC